MGGISDIIKYENVTANYMDEYHSNISEGCGVPSLEFKNEHGVKIG